MPHSAASDLGLHYLQRPICPNNSGYYSTFPFLTKSPSNPLLKCQFVIFEKILVFISTPYNLHHNDDEGTKFCQLLVFQNLNELARDLYDIFTLQTKFLSKKQVSETH